MVTIEEGNVVYDGGNLLETVLQQTYPVGKTISLFTTTCFST